MVINGRIVRGGLFFKVSYAFCWCLLWKRPIKALIQQNYSFTFYYQTFFHYYILFLELTLSSFVFPKLKKYKFSSLPVFFNEKGNYINAINCMGRSYKNISIANQSNHLIHISAMHASSYLLYPVFPWSHVGHLFLLRREITLDTTFDSEWWVPKAQLH